MECSREVSSCRKRCCCFQPPPSVCQLVLFRCLFGPVILGVRRPLLFALLTVAKVLPEGRYCSAITALPDSANEQKSQSAKRSAHISPVLFLGIYIKS